MKGTIETLVKLNICNEDMSIMKLCIRRNATKKIIHTLVKKRSGQIRTKGKHCEFTWERIRIQTKYNNKWFNDLRLGGLLLNKKIIIIIIIEDGITNKFVQKQNRVSLSIKVSKLLGKTRVENQLVNCPQYNSFVTVYFTCLELFRCLPDICRVRFKPVN